MRRPRSFSTEFKERAVLRLLAGEGFSALAAELDVRRKLLHDWAKAYRHDGVEGLNRKRGPKPGGRMRRATSERQPQRDPLSQAHARISELERLVGQQQVDLDFFRQALRLTGADSPNGTAPASTRSSKP
jgi:transposase-like protein